MFADGGKAPGACIGATHPTPEEGTAVIVEVGRTVKLELMCGVDMSLGWEAAAAVTVSMPESATPTITGVMLAATVDVVDDTGVLPVAVVAAVVGNTNDVEVMSAPE